ncbi:hypothetical protein RBI12_04910 [Acinetobacter pittii]|uniref:hypothetical protein n=1 Tax=Acinetobacter pittii TaxID=48296 RepID=UPI00366B2609
MADEIVTRQQLVDAGLDAESFQKFISGLDSEDVLTRLGQIYPTLAKLVRMLMETGGWKAYSTEAELLATVPTVNPSVGYAFDTKKLYKWNGTSWTDEGLSPLDLSKSFSKELAFQNQSIAVTAIDTRNRSYNITANAYATYTGWFSYEHRLTGKEQALSGKFAAHYNGAGGNTNTIVIPYITYLDANRIVIASEKDTSAASGKVKEIFSFVPQNAVYVVLSYSTSPTGLPNLSDYGALLHKAFEGKVFLSC